MPRSRPASTPKHSKAYSPTRNSASGSGGEVHEHVLEIQKKIPVLLKRNEKVLEAVKQVNNMSESTSKTYKPTIANKQQMIGKYTTLLACAEKEKELMAKILEDIRKVQLMQTAQQMRSEKMTRADLMHLLRYQADTLPLYVRDVNGHAPPMVGAIPLPENEPIDVGEYVAARIDENWILAEVVEQQSSGKYIVRDIDDDKNVTVSRNRLEVLPHYRAHPKYDSNALFPRDALVLALYPQTTCFYSGVVENPPVKPTDDYLIAFEDPTYQSGLSPPLEVPQRYVIAYKEHKPSPNRKRKQNRKQSDASLSMFTK